MVISKENGPVSNLTGILVLGGSNLEGYAEGRLRLIQIYKLNETEEPKKAMKPRP